MIACNPTRAGETETVMPLKPSKKQFHTHNLMMRKLDSHWENRTGPFAGAPPSARAPGAAPVQPPPPPPPPLPPRAPRPPLFFDSHDPTTRRSDAVRVMSSLEQHVPGMPVAQMARVAGTVAGLAGPTVAKLYNATMRIVGAGLSVADFLKSFRGKGAGKKCYDRLREPGVMVRARVRAAAAAAAAASAAASAAAAAAVCVCVCVCVCV